jgi:hypothetical protein
MTHTSPSRRFFFGNLVSLAPVATIAFSLLGCSGILPKDITPAANVIQVSGNWAFASSSPSAANLPQLSGSLAGTNASISGSFHTSASGACIDAQTIVKVTGSADANNNLILTSAPFASGSVLTVKGRLAADGKSISSASYSVTGGSCAFPEANGSAYVPLTATQYQPISGTYTGTFVDPYGNSLSVVATLTQTTDPDANGTFHLSGNVTYPSGDDCITAPVVTDSTVTGSSLSVTYTQTVNTAVSTVTASGTFNSDATVLTVTNWTTAGACGTDNGTGSLTKQ